MRRRTVGWGLPALVAFLAAACGGGGEVAATSSPATTEAVTTTAGPTTTTWDPVAVRVGLATLLAGEWVGDWRTGASGETGSFSANVRVDAATPSATISIDLGGEVFGEGDPDPFEFVVDLAAAPPYAAWAPPLGDFTFYMTDRGAFTLEAADVPAPGIVSFAATGTAASGRVGLDYTVAFNDGTEVRGRCTLRRPSS